MAKRKKKKIRSRGTGSIYQVKGGKWRVAVTVGVDSKTGRLKRKYKTADTEAEAVQLLNKLLPLAGNTLLQAPERVTVKTWLVKYAELRKHEVRPRTFENYQHYMDKIMPELGGVLLHKLTPLHIRSLYADLTREGLSPSVRQHTHHFFKSALKDAVRLNLIERSPFDAVDRPKGGKVITPKVWEVGEVTAFLKVAEEDRLHGVYFLMLALGLRIGETLGLKWSDFDGERLQIKRTMSVVNNKASFGPPKTERGKRLIYLSPDVVEALHHRREAQAIERDLSRTWQHTDLIFCSTVGTPLNPNNVRRTFRAIAKKADVPRIRLHDLRHTYITLARDAGLDAEVIANRVGQDVKVTMQVYSQITEARKRKAALSLDELLHNDE